MKKPKPDAQKKVTAQTFRRLAKALRVRPRNHAKAAKTRIITEGGEWSRHAHAIKADIYNGIASDCDHEAETLRGMR